MIISQVYGPQFDAKDGTIGKLQLVARFLIWDEIGNWFFYPRQGQYTYSHKEEALSIASKFTNNYPTWRLSVKEFWCYPKHFDPVGEKL